MNTEPDPAALEPIGSTSTEHDEHDDRPDAGVSDLTPDTDSDSESPEPDDEADETEEEDTFPRSYVEKLRKEAADQRTRAKDRDDLAHRLHAALAAATGRLADPDDLPFDEDHLSDPDALNAAVDELLARKPHLASRKPSGDVGQGATYGTSNVDLAGLLRRSAG